MCTPAAGMFVGRATVAGMVPVVGRALAPADMLLVSDNPVLAAGKLAPVADTAPPAADKVPHGKAPPHNILLLPPALGPHTP